MQVAVLGAGAIGFGTAAFLCQQGHDPILWSPSGRRTASLAAGAALTATGAVTGSFRPRIAKNCAEAIAGATTIVLALPGYGHRAVMDAAAPHLRDGQTVIISSHCSFGALYLAKQLAKRGVHVPIVVWGTTVTTGRQKGDTEVNVGNLRKKVDIATLPRSAAERGLALCTELFGDRFVPRADLLAIALSNLNPQNHMGIALCNLTRMERGESWGQNEYLTDAVGRLLEALDAERLAIAAKFGLSVRTIKEHYHLSFNVPMGPVGEMSAQLHARGDGGSGPTTLDTRYVTEDVPFGLVPSAMLGRLVGAPAVLHESGIEIFSALYGRDFRKENDLLPELGLERLSVTALEKLAREGWPAV
jgi:opine dehydrogenase